MVKEWRPKAVAVLFVAALALAGCSGGDGSSLSGSNGGNQRGGGAPAGSVITDEDGIVALGPEKTDAAGYYRWQGDDLYIASGVGVQILGDSAIPQRVVPEGARLDLYFATLIDHDVTITFDGLATEAVEIALPRNFNFAVGHDSFESSVIYDGCWGGNCLGGMEVGFSGSGTDQVADTGNENLVTFNFVNGESGRVRIYNQETAKVETVMPEDDGVEETVVTLTADVLFEFAKSTLTPGADEEILAAAAEIPQGAHVRVDGHTDSKGGDDINIPLSNDRARTVADVLRQARPDLTLTEQGHSSSEPVAPNEIDGKDNPAGRALNRRVVMSYPSA
ncbi:MAG: OmpA family protein [Bifidobacteriaceae bacterium]|jgi:outer membrane protein OmpA-like peptidoglycan-associated protein|nr:OmpA family protein [Bifidobacteriaceae bacterium]